MLLQSFTHLDNDMPSSVQSVPLLPLIGQDIGAWQIHRCQVTEAHISQHLPMKMLYFYEQLSDEVKQAHPLTGALLAKFDTLMTQAQFIDLLKLPASTLPTAWQLKFSGKLVIFRQYPEIALRLQWVNTIKAFETVYQADLTQAVSASFAHWQWVGAVEVVNKNPQLLLTVTNEQGNSWQLPASSQFEPLPAELGTLVQNFLWENTLVQQDWRAVMIERANERATAYLTDN